MVGYGRVPIVAPSGTNLGEEHPVLGLVALDCRDEPEQRKWKRQYHAYYHEACLCCYHFIIDPKKNSTMADLTQELELALEVVSSSSAVEFEELACLLID